MRGMQEDEEAFKHLKRSCGLQDAGISIEQHGSIRGLASDCCRRPADILLSLPWKHALTSYSAIDNLRNDDQKRRGLLPGGFQSLKVALKEGKFDAEVPAGSEWILLLVLHLLRELRNPKSPWLPYIEMLPAVPGSLVKAVCSHGPDATDLLLFSDEELKLLKNEVLENSVRGELRRIFCLHKKLFGGQEPSISFPSFLWAHVLVRSRALDITGVQADQAEAGLAPFREHCLLPVIDFCNHGGHGEANCSLSIRLKPDGQPRFVDLIATKELEAGQQLLLDYGDKSLQEFLQGYGFVPPKHAHEDYNDLGAAWESLHVRGHSKDATMWLTSIHTAIPDGEATPGHAQSLMYMVKDASAAHHAALARAPSLTFLHDQPGRAESKLKAVALGAVEEANILQHILNGIDELLEALGTNSEEKSLLLPYNVQGNDTCIRSEGSHRGHLEAESHSAGSQGVLSQEVEASRKGLDNSNRQWLETQHLQLVVQYRMHRKALLLQVRRSLACQQLLVSSKQ